MGDSRTVLSKNGKAIDLSTDHSCDQEVEKQRILKAGKKVYGGRVDGELKLARAIGDFKYKKNSEIPAKDQAVTAFPEITITKLESDCEFLFLACDGVWDMKTSEKVVE